VNEIDLLPHIEKTWNWKWMMTLIDMRISKR